MHSKTTINTGSGGAATTAAKTASFEGLNSGTMYAHDAVQFAAHDNFAELEKLCDTLARRNRMNDITGLKFTGYVPDKSFAMMLSFLKTKNDRKAAFDIIDAQRRKECIEAATVVANDRKSEKTSIDSEIDKVNQLVSAEITVKKYTSSSSDSKTPITSLNKASVFKSFKAAFEVNDVKQVQEILKYLVGNPSSISSSDVVTIQYLLDPNYNLTNTIPAVVGELISYFDAKEFPKCYNKLHEHREARVLFEAEQLAQTRINLECLVTSPKIRTILAKKHEAFAGWMGTDKFRELHSTALSTLTFPGEETATASVIIPAHATAATALPGKPASIPGTYTSH